MGILNFEFEFLVISENDENIYLCSSYSCTNLDASSQARSGGGIEVHIAALSSCGHII